MSSCRICRGTGINPNFSDIEFPYIENPSDGSGYYYMKVGAKCVHCGGNGECDCAECATE